MNNLITYDDLATLLQTSKDVLYGMASKHPDVFTADEMNGNQYLFGPERVTLIQAWWEEHNSRFRVKARPTDEPAYTVTELEEKFDIPFPTIQYYRRRYGMLYPDYYAPNPNGRGRPIALYAQSTIEEWKNWVEAGRPEPSYMRVKSVVLNQGYFDATVWFGDGTMLGLRGDVWKFSPPPNDPEMAANYIRFAERWVEQSRYREKWKRGKKE